MQNLDLMLGARICMDVRTDVVPAEFDTCFDKSGAFSHLRAATAHADEDEDVEGHLVGVVRDRARRGLGSRS